MCLQLFLITFGYQFSTCSKIMSVSPILTYENPSDTKEAFSNKSIGFSFLYFGCLTLQLKDFGLLQAKSFKLKPIIFFKQFDVARMTNTLSKG